MADSFNIKIPMKKILFLITISFCFSIEAAMKLVKIDKHQDGSYTVTSWINNDGSSDSVKYSTVGDLAKLEPLISKTIHGLPRDADLSVIWFNDDATINRIDYQNFSTTKSESMQSKIISGGRIPDKAKTDTATLRADVLVKTGNPPEVNPPPKVAPPPDIDPIIIP